MWPFGPVALVYDVNDTDGKELPEDVMSFLAHDKSGGKNWGLFKARLKSRSIGLYEFDGGDGKAGYIRRVAGNRERYRVQINKNHDAAVRFVTLAHELGHLYLGHLGPDKKLRVPRRKVEGIQAQEIEAESVAYLVSNRSGVTTKSEKYLSGFVDSRTTVDRFDVHQIMRAAGQVETLLGLEAPGNRFGKAEPRRARR